MNQRVLRSVPMVATFIAAAVVAPRLRTADACLMRDIAEDPLHLALAQQYRGRVIDFEFELPQFGSQGHRSAVAVNSRFAITAYHTYGQYAQYTITNVKATNGLNYITERGNVVGIRRMTKYPGLVYGGNDRALPDIAILEFDAPLPGVVPAVIGSSGAGDVLTCLGFGSRGSPAAGNLGRDGNARGFLAEQLPYLVYDWDGWNAEYYAEADMGYLTGIEVQQLHGQGMNGYSGGPWYNAQGELVGLSVYGTNGTSGGVTGFLKLNQPDVRAWVLANTALPACAVDIGQQGGVPGSDGQLNNNDFIVFIDDFFGLDYNADFGSTGGVAAPDGALDNNDFVVFIDQFFAGCP